MTLGITAGCGSISEPGVEYLLATINGRSVPTALPDRPGFEVIGGGFRLHQGDVKEWIEVRCISPAPPGSTCSLTGTAIWERRGTYGALEWRFYVADGVYFPMEFHGYDQATIRFGSAFEHAFYYTR